MSWIHPLHRRHSPIARTIRALALESDLHINEENPTRFMKKSGVVLGAVSGTT